ncbi:MAG: uracil-DNA glycosylase [Tissierellia bacterium]|nr:uracil-DNA glycosylase [Tissierellia bacterium]
MKVIFNNDWQEVLSEFLNSESYSEIRKKLIEEYRTQIIYPPMDKIYSAFYNTSYENTKVVIIGQDPYHGENQANGLSFSVEKGIRIPPSLLNIYKELMTDLNCTMPKHGDLTKWSKQGVLLFNAGLTVRAGEPASHSKLGWGEFTDFVIKKLNEKETPVVFILWGNFAKSKASFITNPIHKIISGVHPSPLSASRGFFGSKPFSQCNDFLKENNLAEIDWQID